MFGSLRPGKRAGPWTGFIKIAGCGYKIPTHVQLWSFGDTPIDLLYKMRNLCEYE